MHTKDAIKQFILKIGGGVRTSQSAGKNYSYYIIIIYVKKKENILKIYVHICTFCVYVRKNNLKKTGGLYAVQSSG